MNKILRYLNQPFPVNDQPWLAVLAATLTVVFILGIFQPFGFEKNTMGRELVLLGYGIVTAAGTFVVCYIFPLLFKRYYNRENWTVWKNLLNFLFILILIGVGNTFFDWFIHHRSPETFFPLLKSYLVITMLVGIVPVVIITIITQNTSLKHHLREVEEINRILSEKDRGKENNESQKIVFTGNSKDSISLMPETVIYLESAGNYVDIYYKEDDQVKHKLLRATISQIEENLYPFRQFVRCHRAFIINVIFIRNASGNSQGYRLNLRNIDQEIPVSRSYTKAFREHLG